MNSKIYYFLIFLLSMSCAFTSCSKNEDHVDQEWKIYQDQEFTKIATSKEYQQVVSQTGNGSVYWKESSVITDSDNRLRISPQGNPEFTDTVVVRYEGWFFDLQGKKHIFDSTENPSLASNGVNPNKSSSQFAVNGIIQGWTTILQVMTEGEERLVCIPEQLAYGSTGQNHIPAYTTLWFRIKLLKIIPMRGLKNN